MNHYQVKFPFNGATHFGIAESYSDDAKAAQAKGEVIVEDAILPKRYRVKETDITDIPTGNYGPDGFDDEYNRYVQQEYQLAMEHSKGVGKGLKPGKLFSLGVADGNAYYIVTKVNKKTVKVEWRSFQGDRYMDQILGYGGTFPKSQIEHLVIREETLQELFNR